MTINEAEHNQTINSAKRLAAAGLKGDKVYLEPFSPDHRDDPRYLGWLHDYEVIKTLNLPAYVAEPVPYELVAAYCDRLINSDTDLFLAIHDQRDDRFVGTIKAAHIDWYAETADIGIMIGEKSVWGHGIATDSIRLLCTYLFSSMKLRRLTAGAMSINPAMIAVFEKLGFQREGCLRDHDRHENGYCDHIYLGCCNGELASPEV